MILVDSSVWIDYFRGKPTPQTDCLDRLLSDELLVMGDLILTEVLQGFIHERDFLRAQDALGALPVLPLVGGEVALQAARNYRQLRRLGISVRKTMDTLIATACIEKKLMLLYSDRDFDPFVKHLGLTSVLPLH